MQRRWDIVHKLEQKEKALFLKKLTVKKAFKIFLELHNVAYRINDKDELNAINLDRIKVLSNVHFMFNKVR